MIFDTNYSLLKQYVEMNNIISVDAGKDIDGKWGVWEHTNKEKTCGFFNADPNPYLPRPASRMKELAAKMDAALKKAFAS